MNGNNVIVVIIIIVSFTASVAQSIALLSLNWNCLECLLEMYIPGLYLKLCKILIIRNAEV